MLAMILHPETQEKGKAELDCVIGPNRLPTINDWDDLPYVTSIVREVIRWHPSVPLCKLSGCNALLSCVSTSGVPVFRNPIEDDVYNGYFIPKGTPVVGNIWAVNMDPRRYADPEKFDPGRFYTPGRPTRMGSGSGGDIDRDQ